MPNEVSQQSPQPFLELVRRLYGKRDEILDSSNRLVELSYKLEQCNDSELSGLLIEIHKEMNRIISFVHELTPHLSNPGLASAILDTTQSTGLLMNLFSNTSDPDLYSLKHRVATRLRAIGQAANATHLEPTPKSIKQAFGVAVSPRDASIKLYYEHQKDNY